MLSELVVGYLTSIKLSLYEGTTGIRHNKTLALRKGPTPAQLCCRLQRLIDRRVYCSTGITLSNPPHPLKRGQVSFTMYTRPYAHSTPQRPAQRLAKDLADANYSSDANYGIACFGSLSLLRWAVSHKDGFRVMQHPRSTLSLTDRRLQTSGPYTKVIRAVFWSRLSSRTATGGYGEPDRMDLSVKRASTMLEFRYRKCSGRATIDVAEQGEGILHRKSVDRLRSDYRND